MSDPAETKQRKDRQLGPDEGRRRADTHLDQAVSTDHAVRHRACSSGRHRNGTDRCRNPRRTEVAESTYRVSIEVDIVAEGGDPFEGVGAVISSAAREGAIRSVVIRPVQEGIEQRGLPNLATDHPIYVYNPARPSIGRKHGPGSDEWCHICTAAGGIGSRGYQS